MTTANWYHCSVKAVSRSAGRSVVAAAAYRLGEKLHDETYDITHDYTRRRGVETTFTLAPEAAPAWALDPEELWNAAERSERRKNSTLGREIELALPAFLEPDARRSITTEFARELIDRYSVAVSVAIHKPSRNGDQRNYHAHVLLTARAVGPDGLGKKTRILDDMKTGPKQVESLRELAADIINRHLADAKSDIRVDHRSFKDRGIDQEPTTHLGPSASEMERQGKKTDRGDKNRETEAINSMIEERRALDGQILKERERESSPPATPEDARQRIDSAAAPLVESIRRHGHIPDIQKDGMTWWQRVALHISVTACSLGQAIAAKAKELWQERFSTDREGPDNRREEERGLDR
jgi:hypothetical protein